MTTLGIIAGNGEFPLLLAKSAREQSGMRTVAAAFEGETDPSIDLLVDEVEWVRVGQLNKLIHVFTSRGVDQVVMAGGITPSSLFKNLKLDIRMMGLLARLRERNAESIFGAVGDEMKKDGIELVDPRPYFGASVPSAGCLTKRKLKKKEEVDVSFGYEKAKAVSALNIGQTVVVKQGTVLAVEGFEGTDECIRRGGALAGEEGGAVVVKVSKPNHDFRFDIPCVGKRTIESCWIGKIKTLAIEAGKTLLLDRDAVLDLANEHGLAIVAMQTE